MVAHLDLNFIDIRWEVGNDDLVRRLGRCGCRFCAVCYRSDTSPSGGAVGSPEDLSLACWAATGPTATSPGAGSDNLREMGQ